MHRPRLVKYSVGGGGVGSGKPVYVYTSEEDWEETETSGSWYNYSFYSGTYFEKVMCIFNEDNQWYQGTTMIQQTLYRDKRYDITVSEVQDPGKK